ncbi:hypothetical protein AB0K43_17155 [Kitasatospora sp. NPDC049258]|uniref:hypothetical protein n=1 Tax=Kitasatospora sp. NPDC049258 TaxID=3155394 RepID=UPI003433060B
MDALRVSALREALAGTGWPECAREFGGELRRAVARGPFGGLLLVGTTGYEPWHLAAHLDEQARWSGAAALAPVLLRRSIPPGAPAHLAHGLERLVERPRGATVLVVAPGAADEVLLERVQDARRGGATVLALDDGEPQWASTAHQRLTVPGVGAEPFDLIQHLVGAAAGARPRRGPRLGRLAGLLTGRPAPRW